MNYLLRTLVCVRAYAHALAHSHEWISNVLSASGMGHSIHSSGARADRQTQDDFWFFRPTLAANVTLSLGFGLFQGDQSPSAAAANPRGACSSTGAHSRLLCLRRGSLIRFVMYIYISKRSREEDKVA
jgi:hypothetical protein